MMADVTSIQVSKQLRAELAKFGAKDDTFESIIKRLLTRAGAGRK